MPKVDFLEILKGDPCLRKQFDFLFLGGESSIGAGGY